MNHKTIIVVRLFLGFSIASMVMGCATNSIQTSLLGFPVSTVQPWEILPYSSREEVRSQIGNPTWKQQAGNQIIWHYIDEFENDVPIYGCALLFLAEPEREGEFRLVGWRRENSSVETQSRERFYRVATDWQKAGTVSRQLKIDPTK